MSDLPPVSLLVKLTGPLLLGHFFNWGLFGVLVVQTYVYYLAFPHDSKLSKTVAYTITGIETLQTILATRDAFRNFGPGFGDMNQLDLIGWLWFSVPVLSGLIALLVQVFFAWRIYVLSGKWYISSIVTALSVVSCGAAIWAGQRAHFYGRFSLFANPTFPISTVWLGCSTAADLVIAAAMIYYISHSGRGFRSSNVLLTRIIRVTIETGLFCAGIAIIDLALFLSFKNFNYHLAPSVALSKLYSNSLLAVFNARVRFIHGRARSSDDVDEDVMYGTTTFARGTITRVAGSNSSPNLSTHKGMDDDGIAMTVTGVNV